ncbi:type I restriction enzyme HsdR N-terminal domain-containing protein [Thermus caliditerrae]|uniref:type I restriction enzyme HsdR N-terminal domain-containing protein n=1 Tax=Thermus caliditerrae TaxID=1330700 RepID=UPI000689E3D8|nr:type I restriction enzyme HsdR N-terminal domain-containing protein [Thermus caliditerrae]
MSTQLSDVIQEIVDNLDRWKGLNEAQTTQVIILRLLQALGWNIWNPEEVVAQDTSAKGYRPDYILSVRRTPVLVLEVKGLDRTPNNEDRTQVVNYANAQNIRWAILTTGKQWEFFDNTLQAKAPEKRSLLFELDNPSAARYLERTLKRDLWEAKEASAKLARIVEEIRKEIETQQSLTRIEHKLRVALEEGYQRSEKGLRKALSTRQNVGPPL